MLYTVHCILTLRIKLAEDTNGVFKRFFLVNICDMTGRPQGSSSFRVK